MAWVAGVSDGDTVTVLRESRQTIRVRLASIDAPERSQAFGQVCRQALAAQIFHRDVLVRPIAGNARDAYGRLIATLELDGQDINLAMVHIGCAWHYVEFARRTQRGEDFGRYAGAEQQARAARAGLWADSNPVPPSLYRRGSK